MRKIISFVIIVALMSLNINVALADELSVISSNDFNTTTSGGLVIEGSNGESITEDSTIEVDKGILDKIEDTDIESNANTDGVVTIPGETGESIITLEVDESGLPPIEDIFSATVPIELPIHMASDGTVTVPTNAYINNNSQTRGIAVTNIKCTTANGWSIADFEQDIASLGVDTKSIGVKFRGTKVEESGSTNIQKENWGIGENSRLELGMQVKLPKQSVASKTEIATISFTLDWADGPVIPSVEHTVTVEQGEHGTVSSDSIKVIDGETITLPAATPDSGYILEKWVNTATGEEFTQNTIITGDITIKPVFKAVQIEEHTVKFETGDKGTYVGTNPLTVSHGEEITLTNPSVEPGWTFQGWVDQHGTKLGNKVIVNENLTLTAQYEGVMRTVRFEAMTNGSLTGTLEVQVKNGNTVIFPTPVANSGYEFDKWTLNGTTYEVNPLTIIDSNCSIQAHFKAKAASPSAWFMVDNTGTLTGFTDEYANMPNAPTDLIIPNQVGGVQVTKIGDNAFKGRSALTSVVLNRGITSIGVSAFESCSSLIDLRLSDNLINIGSRAFAKCAQIKSITLPNKTETIGDSAFLGCTSMTSIELPGSITEIKPFAFSGVATKTFNLKIDGRIAIADNVFDSSSTVNIQSGKLSSITGIEYLAANKTNVYINRPGGMQKVQFYDTTMFSKLTVFIDENDEVMDNVNLNYEPWLTAWEAEFKWNEVFPKEQYVDGGLATKIPSYANGRVINRLYYLFRAEENDQPKYFPYLTKFPIIPETVTDLEQTFYGCNELTGTVTIPKGVTSMKNTFKNTVKPITMRYYKDCKAAVDYVAPSNVTKVQID